MRDISLVPGLQNQSITALVVFTRALLQDRRRRAVGRLGSADFGANDRRLTAARARQGRRSGNGGGERRRGISQAGQTHVQRGEQEQCGVFHAAHFHRLSCGDRVGSDRCDTFIATVKSCCDYGTHRSG